MNACQAVRELLAADALCALEDGQGALLREHLVVCADCRDEQARTAAAIALLAAPPVEPPPEVWEKLRGRLERERGGDAPVRDVAEPGAVIAVSCSFCRGGLVRADTVYCASCLAPHHADCFAEHGRCSVMGCGETRVVRPESLPAPARREPAPAAPHRWRWLAGGLLGLCAGGAVAALSLQSPRPPEPPPALEALQTAAVVAPPQLDVEVREATVGELCQRLELVSGVKLHVHPEAAGRVLADREWWDADWRVVLDDVAREAGLELVVSGEGGPSTWALLAPPEGDRAGVRPPERTWVTAAHLLQPTGPGSWSQTGLSELADARALVAPGGERLVVIGERRVRLFRGDRLLGGLRLREPALDAGWSPDGKELFLLCGGQPGGTMPMLRLEARESGLVPVARLELPGVGGAADWQAVTPAGAGWVLVAGGRGAAMVHVRETPHPLMDLPAGSMVPLRMGALQACAQLPQGVLAADSQALYLIEPGGSARALANLDEGLARLTLSPTAAGQRVLVQQPGRARVLLLTPDAGPRGLTAAWEPNEIAHLPGPWPWPAGLSPDGRRAAWVEGGTLFLRDLAGGPDAGIPPLDLVGDPTGLGWSPDGKALVVWSEKAASVVEPGEGRDRCTQLLELPEGPGALQGVQWLDARRLVVVTSQERARSPRVSVLPSRPGAFAWVRLERDESAPLPLPAASREPVEPITPAERDLEREEPPGPSPGPSSEPAVAESPGRVDLSHVRPLQRWVFRLGEPGDARVVREEWVVRKVERDRVSYERRVLLDGQQIGETATEIWTPDLLLTGEVRGEGRQRELRTLGFGELQLSVWVDRQEQARVELWRVAGADPERRYTFPGTVRDVRAGRLHRWLESVE